MFSACACIVVDTKRYPFLLFLDCRKRQNSSPSSKGKNPDAASFRDPSCPGLWTLKSDF